MRDYDDDRNGLTAMKLPRSVMEPSHGNGDCRALRLGRSYKLRGRVPFRSLMYIAAPQVHFVGLFQYAEAKQLRCWRFGACVCSRIQWTEQFDSWPCLGTVGL